MSALSIRHMNHTLQMREHAQAQLAAEVYAMQSTTDQQPLHYWHIEKRSKRKVKGQYRWIFVRELFATKQKAAEIFVERYGHEAGYRLHHIYKYR